MSTDRGFRQPVVGDVAVTCRTRPGPDAAEKRSPRRVLLGLALSGLVVAAPALPLPTSAQGGSVSLDPARAEHEGDKAQRVDVHEPEERSEQRRERIAAFLSYAPTKGGVEA